MKPPNASIDEETADQLQVRQDIVGVFKTLVCRLER